MLESNAQGLYAFFKMFYAGALMGLCYDIAINAVFFNKRNRSGADVMFACASFVILLASLFAAAKLKLRLYLFMGAAVGWGVYFAFISSLVNDILKAVRCGIRNLLEPLNNFVNRFALKHKKSISKVNLIYRKAKSIPNRIKKSYNKYAEFIFKGRENSD